MSTKPPIEELIHQTIDVYGGRVEVDVREDGKVLWVNVEGVCLFRASQFEELRFSNEEARVHNAKGMTPKEVFLQVLDSALAEFQRIDKDTPWSPVEPKWWLEMMALQRTLMKTKEALAQ